MYPFYRLRFVFSTGMTWAFLKTGGKDTSVRDLFTNKVLSNTVVKRQSSEYEHLQVQSLMHMMQYCHLVSGAVKLVLFRSSMICFCREFWHGRLKG